MLMHAQLLSDCTARHSQVYAQGKYMVHCNICAASLYSQLCQMYVYWPAVVSVCMCAGTKCVCTGPQLCQFVCVLARSVCVLARSCVSLYVCWHEVCVYWPAVVSVCLHRRGGKGAGSVTQPGHCGSQRGWCARRATGNSRTPNRSVHMALRDLTVEAATVAALV
jgi:hypothetical protein